jgi:hypothetical protein
MLLELRQGGLDERKMTEINPVGVMTGGVLAALGCISAVVLLVSRGTGNKPLLSTALAGAIICLLIGLAILAVG